MADRLTDEQLEQLLAGDPPPPGELLELLGRSAAAREQAARTLGAVRLAAALDPVAFGAAGGAATPPPPPELEAAMERIFARVDPAFRRLAAGPTPDPDAMRLRTLAVMFTDLAGSTAFAQRYGARAAFRKRQTHNGLLLPLVEQHRGTLIKIVGDALLVTFDDAADAARCAVAMQRRLAAYNRENQDQFDDPDQEIHVRVGFHWGKVICFEEFGRPEVSGQGVNAAARVESAGGKQPDQILLSEPTVARLLLRGREFAAVPAGTTHAKGIGEMRIFRLLWDEAELAAATATPSHPQTLAAQTVLLPADELSRLEDTRAVHCLFVDPAVAAKAYARPVWARVKPSEAPSVKPRMECDRVMEAAAARAAEAGLRGLQRLGFRGADPARLAVEWWVEGPPARYAGASLGLGIALAAAAAYAGVPIDPGVVVTGAVDGERVLHVEGVEHKYQAVRDARTAAGGRRFGTMALPADDLPRLPSGAGQNTELRLLPVSSLEDAILDVLGPALGLAGRQLSAAAPATAPPPAAADSPGGVNLQLWVQPATKRTLTRDIRVKPKDDTRSWKVGDEVRVCVSADRDCHVAVVNLGSSGKVTVLLPNSWHPDTFLRAGQVASYPSGDEFTFELIGPPGRERLIALASNTPLKLTPQDFDQSGQLVVAQPRTRDIAIVAKAAGAVPQGRCQIEFFVSE